MEKKVVAEMIFREYEGGNPSSEGGLQLIDFIKRVDAARAYKILDDYRTSMRMEGERILNEAWLKTYSSVPVVYNATNDVYYSVLPEKVLGLPKGNGLYFVSRTQDLSKPFAKMSTSDIFVMSQLFDLEHDSTIYYRQDMDNIIYINFDPAIKNSFVQLVPLVSDEIPDEFVYQIIELVINRFLKTKNAGVILDKISDNNPNIEASQ